MQIDKNQTLEWPEQDSIEQQILNNMFDNQDQLPWSSTQTRNTITVAPVVGNRRIQQVMMEDRVIGYALPSSDSDQLPTPQPSKPQASDNTSFVQLVLNEVY